MPNITAITLGVADLAASLKFYRALGFKPGFVSKEVIFFQLNGTVLALFGRDDLAVDARLSKGKARPGGMSLAINLPSKRAVDALMAKARRVKATVSKAPVDAAWSGYSGYFSDPDGHLWELAWNPFWKLDKKGNVSLK